MKKALFIILLFTVCTVYAKPIDVTPTDRNIISFIFNGQWEKADSLVDLQIKNNLKNPKYYFMKAYVAMYSRNFSATGLTRDELLRKIDHYAWEAIKVGEKAEKTIETNFYIGNAYALLSRMNVMRGEYWTAYWNAGKCENYLEEVIEEDPTVEDAYFNLGVTEYFADRNITGFRGFLTSLGGMGGDAEKGLKYIERTAEKGNLFKDEAKFGLTIAYRFEQNKNEEALAVWDYLRNKYPNTNAFENGYLQLTLINEIDKRGAKFLEEEFDTIVEKYKITNEFVLNTIGYTLTTQNKLDDALIVFQINLKLYPNVANCYDSLAECFMNRGDNKNAIKYYKMAFKQLDADTTSNPAFLDNLRESIPQRLSDLDAPLDV